MTEGVICESQTGGCEVGGGGGSDSPRLGEFAGARNPPIDAMRD